VSAPTTAVDVLIAHQRRDAGSCLCGWAELGRSHAAHQADALREAGLLAETTVEWGIKALFDRGTILPKPAEHALDAVQRFPRDWALVRREVTAWTQVHP
jgi:hypothetical protein